MCAVLHGVLYEFFKMAAGNFASNRVFSFSQLFFLFWEEKYFPEFMFYGSISFR
jgi:hypothetical protein